MINLKTRKIINVLGKTYYSVMPRFIVNSKIFHQILYRFLIGSWFEVDFGEKHKKYQEADWVKLYDSLFENRIREDDLTTKQKTYLFDNIIGQSVFEVGSGTGTVIADLILKSNIKKIVGNDISPKAISFLKERFRNNRQIRFIGGDFINLNIKEKFDTVLCLHVIEHIKNIKKASLVLQRLSSKRIIVIVPNEINHRYPPNYHLHFFNQKNLITNYFSGRKNYLKIIDGDYVLISDKI